MPLHPTSLSRSKRIFRARCQPVRRVMLVSDPDPFQPLSNKQASDKHSHRINKNGEGIKNKMHRLALSRRFHYKILGRSVSSVTILMKLMKMLAECTNL